MLEAMRRHCGEVTPLGPAGAAWKDLARCGAWTMRHLFGTKIDPSHLTAISRAYACIFQRRLALTNPDLIFAPFASTEFAFLRAEQPIIYLSDLTARLFGNYSERLTGIARWSLEQTEEIERRALMRADHIVYPSEWAANSAVDDYGVTRDKICIIPFGANLAEIPAMEDIMAVRSHFPRDICHLLFIGVDWQRKGGDIALEAMRRLNLVGINTTLTVVGCIAPNKDSDSNVRVIPKLDKRLAADRMQLKELFLTSDILLFPTRRDASPIVVSEASAFGLPVIAPDVGGLAVWDHVNGRKLPASAGPGDYAEAAMQLIRQPARYLELAISARRLFESRLNWDSWGKAMADVFSSVLETRKPRTVTPAT